MQRQRAAPLPMQAERQKIHKPLTFDVCAGKPWCRKRNGEDNT